jgi:tetratricopeptide (TPR) repeat protein
MKALEISKKTLGKEHHITAIIYDSIAGAYLLQGDYENALDWTRKALPIFETLLGKEHPDTAKNYQNIAYIYQSMHDYSKALEWYKRAVPVFVVAFGFKQSTTQTVLGNAYNAFKQTGGNDEEFLEWVNLTVESK